MKKKISAIEEGQYVDTIINPQLDIESCNIESIVNSRIQPGNSHWFYFDKLYSVLRQGPKRKVLDVACGIGFLSVLLARYGHQVVAVDVSKKLYCKSQETCYFVRL